MCVFTSCQQSLYGLLQSCCMCDAQVLSKSEVEWVNNYHKEVWEKASPPDVGRGARMAEGEHCLP